MPAVRLRDGAFPNISYFLFSSLPVTRYPLSKWKEGTSKIGLFSVSILYVLVVEYLLEWARGRGMDNDIVFCRYLL